MWKVFGLLLGDYTYKEYFPIDGELQIIKTSNPSMYMILSDLACHFHICDNHADAKGHCIWNKKWVDYMSTNLDSKGVIDHRHYKKIGNL